jgi:DNA repair protein RadC
MSVEQHIVPLYHLELVREKDLPYTKVDREEAAAEVFHQMLDSAHVEKLACIHLTSGMLMIGAEVVAIGGIERVGAAMGDLFKGAVRNNAAAIWMAHNHVDGDVRASMPDYSYTLKAVAAGQLLDIRVHDHLVIGPGAHYSIFAHREELDRNLRLLEVEALKKKLLGALPGGRGGKLPFLF